MISKDNVAARNWTHAKVGTFWGKIAKSEHIFLVYEIEERFLDILAGFVGTGINADDCSIVIGTNVHLVKLKQRLISHGIKVDSLVDDERLVTISVESILERIMVNGFPKQDLFFEAISEIIGTITHKERHLRIFREIGPVLWAQGNHTAAKQVENFWRQYKQQWELSLFCAYPNSHFITDDCSSIKGLGITKSKLVTHSSNLTEVLYMDCTELAIT